MRLHFRCGIYLTLPNGCRCNGCPQQLASATAGVRNSGRPQQRASATAVQAGVCAGWRLCRLAPVHAGVSTIYVSMPPLPWPCLCLGFSLSVPVPRFLSVCAGASVSLCLCLCLGFCLSVSVPRFLPVCVCASVSACLCRCLGFSLSMSVPRFLPVCVCASVSACLCLFVCICLSVYVPFFCSDIACFIPHRRFQLKPHYMVHSNLFCFHRTSQSFFHKLIIFHQHNHRNSSAENGNPPLNWIP